MAKLAEIVGSAVADGEILRRTAALGLQPAFMAPQAFAAHISRQFEIYSKVIDDAGIKGE